MPFEPCIYVFTCDADISKVGIASNVRGRFSTCQSSSPLKLHLFNVYSLKDLSLGYEIEQACHQELWPHHSHGEWFKVNGLTAWECVKKMAVIKETEAKSKEVTKIKKKRINLPPVNPEYIKALRRFVFDKTF